MKLFRSIYITTRKLIKTVSKIHQHRPLATNQQPPPTNTVSPADHDLRIAYLRDTLSAYNKPNYYDTLISKKPSLASLDRAAILIPISVRMERNRAGNFVQKSFFTFTQRSNKMRTLKGVCCFVGGKRDMNTDVDDVATAFREANEEIGVEASRLTTLAQLYPMMAFADQSGSLVTPVISYFNREGFEAKCNESEVGFEFEIETDRFLITDNYKRKSVHSHGREHYFHYFNFEIDESGENKKKREVSIWGMTSYLAIMVASMLHSRLPAFVYDPERKLDGKNYNEFNEWYMLDKSETFLQDLVDKKNKHNEYK